MEHVLPTVIIASVILLAFAAVVVKLVIDKKRGKHSCSCGGSCATCPCGCGTQSAKKNK